MQKTTVEFNRTAEHPALSVCMCVKNRSRILHDNQEIVLFPKCVRSLVNAAAEFSSNKSAELVVVDYESDDWPLTEWFPDAIGGMAARILFVSGEYSRGAGLNRAAAAAEGDRLFFCDADMLITGELLSRGIELIGQNKAFFPIRRCIDRDGRLLDLDPFAKGNAFLSRTCFDKIGGVPQFTSWGGDDDLFFLNVAEQASVHREHVAGFHHLWHPELSRHENYARRPLSDFQETMLAARPAAPSSRVRPRTNSVADPSPVDSNLPFLTCLCPTYKRPLLLANLLYCFEQFDYPSDRCQLIVLDDNGQFPDQPHGKNWKVVSHSRRYATLGDKRNALAEMAPEMSDAFVVLDDDEAYLPWTLRAQAWALERSELSCPDRVLVEDADSTLLMERVEFAFHPAWAFSRNLFYRSGGYPSINHQEDLALLDIMIKSGCQPVSATHVWPPWLISRWEGTGSYHLSTLAEDEYSSISQPDCEQVVSGLRPEPIKDWLAVAIELFGFGDLDWDCGQFKQAWRNGRRDVERTMIARRKRLASLQRRRAAEIKGDP